MFRRDAMRRAWLVGLAAVAAAVMATGCDKGVRPSEGFGSTLAVAPDDPEANGTVRGQILGLFDASENTTPVPGATVKIEHVVPWPADSIYNWVPVGTVVTDGNGQFELTSVPEGMYTLRVSPPAGSRCLPGEVWELTAAGTGILEASITLACRS